ncbi:MAG: preprotein translocase subunit YajC [Chlamydiales bacterium]|nr:preprotein translocase subunit YajC [Chlamydiales bacterium]
MAKKWIFSALLLATTTLYAQTEDVAVAPEQGSYWQTIMMIGIAIVFFYFILWRPEQKRRKAMETQRSSMKKGDRVTSMGIIGTIIRVSADSPTVILKMYDGSKIEVLKAAITEVHPGTEEDARKAEKEDALLTAKD